MGRPRSQNQHKYNRHYTHHTVYRTTNILADDADFATVENKYLYVDDVPLSKMGYAITYSQEPNGNTGIVTFESPLMSEFLPNKPNVIADNSVVLPLPFLPDISVNPLSWKLCSAHIPPTDLKFLKRIDFNDINTCSCLFDSNYTFQFLN